MTLYLILFYDKFLKHSSTHSYTNSFSFFYLNNNRSIKIKWQWSMRRQLSIYIINKTRFRNIFFYITYILFFLFEYFSHFMFKFIIFNISFNILFIYKSKIFWILFLFFFYNIKSIYRNKKKKIKFFPLRIIYFFFKLII